MLIMIMITMIIIIITIIIKTIIIIIIKSDSIRKLINETLFVF